MTRLLWLSAAASVALLTGCQGEPWVVAEEVAAARAPGSDAADQPSYGCAGAAELLGERQTRHGVSQVGERHLGRWRGNISGSAAGGFPGSDVEVTLNPDHTGTLLFVGTEPPPAPESATQGYLCDGTISGGVCGSPSGFVGGFAYELLGIATRGDVVSFMVIDADPWAAWCELQAPIERVDADATCGHSWAVLPLGTERWSPEGCAAVLADGSESPIDCGLMYALERCQCAPDACFGSFYTGIEVGMDLSDDGQELRGSLWLRSNVDAALLRLRRQP